MQVQVYGQGKICPHVRSATLPHRKAQAATRTLGTRSTAHMQSRRATCIPIWTRPGGHIRTRMSKGQASAARIPGYKTLMLFFIQQTQAFANILDTVICVECQVTYC